MEIERKFKVKSAPENLNAYRKIKMSQGYISVNPTIRIRKEDGLCFLTIKGSGGLAHEEYQLEITNEQFEGLTSKLETPFLEKTRYVIPLPCGLTAELDIFEGVLSSLMVVEVEFESVEQACSFEPPYWFGEDVTEDYRYKNTSLSIHGIPE